MQIKFIQYIIPPEKWRLPVIITIGILFGITIFLFHISRASSYISDKPETCINCHVMGPQYYTYTHSSHREVAHCNDCHVPHNNFVSHYYFKAKDGLRHATIFTLRKEAQSIKIKEAGENVVQNNCIRCHNELIEGGKLSSSLPEMISIRKDRQCWDCHKQVPHGDVRSLSATQNAIIPLPESPVPEWLQNAKKKKNK